MPHSPLTIPLTRLPHAADIPLPTYATASSAGMDLIAAIPDDIILQPLQRGLIATGLAIALPAGYEAQVRPRSGLALKQGITVLNSPGTIDADYRGEIGVILINLSAEPVTISRGMRVAQLVIAPYTQGVWEEVATLPESARGAGGFGSTGVDSSAPVATRKQG
jgi:dUTP pyrophosphatase